MSLWVPLSLIDDPAVDAERAICERTGNPHFQLFIAHDGADVQWWRVYDVPTGNFDDHQTQLVYSEEVKGPNPNVEAACASILRNDRTRVRDPFARDRREREEAWDRTVEHISAPIIDRLKYETKKFRQEYTV